MLTSCKECPYKDRQQVPYTGNPQAEILIVGEAPHTEELKIGKPFVGKSGKVVEALLKSIDLDRNDIFITNAVRCQINKDLDSVKTLNMAVHNCRPNVIKAIAAVKPKLIICLGVVATQQILGLKKIMDNRGKFFEGIDTTDYSVKPLLLPMGAKIDPETKSIPVFVTVHPAYVLRGATKGFPDKAQALMSMKEKLIFSDFKLVKDFLKSGVLPEIDFSNYKEASIEDLRRILLHDTVAIDFETTSLNHDTMKLLSVSFSIKDGESRVVIFPTSKRMQEYINKIFSNPKSKKIVAFRPFDEAVAKKQIGVELNGVKHDICSMAHLLDENYFSYSLENIANIYCPLKNIKEIIGKDRGNLASVPREKLLNYNAVDTDAAFRVYNSMRSEFLKDRKLVRYYTKFLNPVQDMFAELYHNGVKVDKTILKRNENIAATKVSNLHKKALSMIPELVRNKYSDNLVLTRSALLIDTLFSKNGFGYKPVSQYMTEKTGKPQTTEDHLMYFADHPFVDTLLQWKKLSKILSYFSTLWEDIRTDGKIYPQTVFIRTVTGRVVMLNPPLLTYPVRDKNARLLLEAIVAEEGWLFGEKDLSQSELRIMGWLAGDKNILTALKDKIDLHVKTAAITNKLPINQVTKDMRQKAKAVNFGFIYGMGEKGFQLYAKHEYGLDFTYEEACSARRNYFGVPTGYYSLPAYHMRQKQIAHKQGYVESVLGRKRRLPDIYSEDISLMRYAERQAVNFPTQGFSTDLGVLGMLMCYKELKSDPIKARKMKLLWHCHDSERFMAQEDFMPVAMKLMKECMEERASEYIKKEFGVEIGYPIETEGQSANNLADIK